MKALDRWRRVAHGQRNALRHPPLTPKQQKRGAAVPTTPVMSGPQCSPTRSSSGRPSGVRSRRTAAASSLAAASAFAACQGSCPPSRSAPVRAPCSVEPEDVVVVGGAPPAPW